MAASFRVVGGPTAFTDKSEHSVSLFDAVLPGETVVILTGCSVTDINGIVGYADADAGPFLSAMSPIVVPAPVGLWQLDQEFGGAGGGGYNGVSCFSSYMPDGLASGSTVRFGVKYDGAAFYHGQSPWAVVLALNSGDGRALVYDTGASSSTGATTTPATPSIISAADAIVLAFFAGTTAVGAGWFTPGAGWTEFADTAQGTESNFNVAGEGRIATSSYSGTGSGVSSVSANFGALIVSYKAVSYQPTKGPPFMLLGTRAPGVTSDFFASTHTAAWPFTALADGFVTAIAARLHEDNANLVGVKLGIYSHDAGNNRPLTLLGSGPVSPNPVNFCPFKALIPAVRVAKGTTTYWLAISGSGEQIDIQGLSSAAVGREGTGEMVNTWVAAGNMGVLPGIWAEGSPLGYVPQRKAPGRVGRPGR